MVAGISQFRLVEMKFAKIILVLLLFSDAGVTQELVDTSGVPSTILKFAGYRAEKYGSFWTADKTGCGIAIHLCDKLLIRTIKSHKDMNIHSYFVVNGSEGQFDEYSRAR